MWKISKLFALFAILIVTSCGAEQKLTTETTVKMTSDHMAKLIQKFDENAKVTDNSITFSLRERDLMLVFDNKADRMRVMTPIIQASAVPEPIYERMLQANFDAVLDSRYAISNDLVWAVFIHKLSTLTDADLRSAIAQTHTAAETFGSTYTSGAIVFGGGDTNSIHNELLKELESQPDPDNQGI